MKAVFKQIPEPLQRQILTRLGLGALFLVLLIVLLFTARDILIWLPCAGVCLFLFAAALALFRRAALGDYVVISGVCQSVERTAIRRRIKYITLQTEEYIVQVTPRIRKISEGSALDLYVAKSTPLYEKGGVQLLYHYLAMEIKRGGAS